MLSAFYDLTSQVACCQHLHLQVATQTWLCSRGLLKGVDIKKWGSRWLLPSHHTPFPISCCPNQLGPLVCLGQVLKWNEWKLFGIYVLLWHFRNFNVPTNSLGLLLKHRFWSSRFKGSLRVCILTSNPITLLLGLLLSFCLRGRGTRGTSTKVVEGRRGTKPMWAPALLGRQLTAAVSFFPLKVRFQTATAGCSKWRGN